MTEYVPQVGDFVQIKGIKQLKDEYREFPDGSFDTPGFRFTRGMRPICGKSFHVDRICIDRYSGTPYLMSVEGIENDRQGDDIWYISAAMVNLIDSDVEQEQDIDEDAWLSLL